MFSSALAFHCMYVRAHLTRMSNNSTDDVRNVRSKSAGVVPLMFMSSSLVKELRVPEQKAELTNKTRQNNVHQHTEAAICGAILAYVYVLLDKASTLLG